MTDEFCARVTKIISKTVSHELTAYLSISWIMAIVPKECKPDNFELYNSLKINFMNIQGICLNFIDWESFLETNSPDILASCETNLDDWVDSGNFSVRGYICLIQKCSTTDMCGVAVYVKEVLSFAQNLSPGNSSDSYVFNWLYFTQYLTSLYSVDHPLCDFISSNIGEVPIIDKDQPIY